MATIFHVDMDAFFVSVEELFDPSLKGKPVVVGGAPNERGVVAAASYEARKSGVHSAMPLRTAYRLCPQAIFLEGHPERYRQVSARIRRLLGRFSPAIEVVSIDEAFLDMTGTERLHGHPLQAADALHQTIATEVRLNCSIGIAPSRVVAKMMSDLAKPNGVLWVPSGMEAKAIAPLPVRRLPGVGKVLERELHSLGIRTVGALAESDTEQIGGRFGLVGTALAQKAQGLDAGGWYDEAIGESSAPKSIGHEHTFSRDTEIESELRAALARLAEMTARRLREARLNASTLHLKLRYADFSTLTRAKTLEEPTSSDTVIFEIAWRLFAKTRRPNSRIRLLGIRTTNFQPESAQIPLLAAGEQERWRRALEAADRLRDKFGDRAVSLASALPARFRERIQEHPAERRKSGTDPEP